MPTGKARVRDSRLPSFNSGIWNDLEDLEAEYADEYGAVWIIAGPIFNNLKPSLFIGEQNKGELLIAAPDALFKIIVRETGDGESQTALAFVYWQSKAAIEQSPYDHAKYLTSIDNIERLTAIDFFTALPDQIEQGFESHAAKSLW